MRNDNEDGTPGGRVTLVCAGHPTPERVRSLVENAAGGVLGDTEVVVCATPRSAGDGAEDAASGVSVVDVPLEASVVGALGSAAAGSTTELVAFCRGERLPPASWLEEAAAAFDADARLAVVGSHLDPRAQDRPAVLAVLADGLVVRRDAFERSGGLDDRLGLDGAALDLCWRLTVLGYRVRAIGSAWSEELRGHHRSTEQERQQAKLVAAATYLEDDNLPPFVASAIAEEVRRSIVSGGADATALDLQRSPGGDDVGTIALAGESLDGARAVEAFLDALPAVSAARVAVAAARRVPDRSVFPLLTHELDDGWLAGAPVPGAAEVRRALGAAQLLAEPLRVAIFGASPAAEAQRSASLARLLDGTGPTVHLVPDDAPGHEQEAMARWADVVVLPGAMLPAAPWAAVLPRQVVVLDLDRADGVPAEVLSPALDRADLVVCRSEDDRDYWLGALAGRERINAVVYDEDESLDSLALVAPDDDAAGLAVLAAFCREPRRAADLTRAGDVLHLGGARDDVAVAPQGAVARGRRAAGGLVTAVRRAGGRITRKVRRPQ